MGLRRHGFVAPAAARARGDPLPDDICHWLARHFTAAERAAALACLEAAVLHNGQAAGARLLRCAAVASRGDLLRLRQQVERLRIDWRDVVVEGEYAISKGRLARVRDLAEPLQD